MIFFIIGSNIFSLDLYFFFLFFTISERARNQPIISKIKSHVTNMYIYLFCFLKYSLLFVFFFFCIISNKKQDEEAVTCFIHKKIVYAITHTSWIKWKKKSKWDWTDAQNAIFTSHLHIRIKLKPCIWPKRSEQKKNYEKNCMNGIHLISISIKFKWWWCVSFTKKKRKNVAASPPTKYIRKVQKKVFASWLHNNF